MTNQTTTPAINLTDACTMAIAAGQASDGAIRAFSDGQNEAGQALNKLSLRFAELALEYLGGEAGRAGSHEAAGA